MNATASREVKQRKMFESGVGTQTIKELCHQDPLKKTALGLV